MSIAATATAMSTHVMIKKRFERGRRGGRVAGAAGGTRAIPAPTNSPGLALATGAAPDGAVSGSQGEDKPSAVFAPKLVLSLSAPGGVLSSVEVVSAIKAISCIVAAAGVLFSWLSSADAASTVDSIFDGLLSVGSLSPRFSTVGIVFAISGNFSAVSSIDTLSLSSIGDTSTGNEP